MRWQKSDELLTHKHQAKPLPKRRQLNGCGLFYSNEKVELSRAAKNRIIFPHRHALPVTRCEDARETRTPSCLALAHSMLWSLPETINGERMPCVETLSEKLK